MKIAFLGDIAFVGRFDLSRNEKVSDNLEEIASFLRGFDYVIANLESPLTDKPTSSMCKAIHLKADPVNIDLLKRLNVKLVNLSNNHIFDYEVKGYRDTVRVLDENGIDYFGVDDRQFLLDFEGNRVAFSGYCCYSANGSRYKGEYDKDYITPVDSRVLESRLEEDQRNGCLSVLSIHWGIENIHFPAAEHMRLARSLARTNRFILYGHHPHVAQGVENVNDAVVAYSLGNFMFDEVPSRVIKGLKNKMSPNNRESFILTVDISENRIVETGVVHFAETDGKITLRDNASFPDYCAHLKADPQTYEANRTEALKHLASDVAGRHDISWILKRLNYKFIGAYLKGRRNSKKIQPYIQSSIVPMSSSPKIVYIGQFLYPDGNAAANRVVSNGRIFRSLGYETLFIGTNRNTRPSVPIEETRIDYDGFSGYSIPYPAGIKGWIAYRNEYRRISRFLEGMDNIKAVVLYGSPTLSLFCGAMRKWCKKRRITLISDAVDWLSASTGSLPYRIIKYLDTVYQKVYFNSRTDGVIAVSNYLNDYYAAKGCRTVVIPPLTNCDAFRFVENDSPKIQLVYVGVPFAVDGRKIKTGSYKDRLDVVLDCLVALAGEGFDFSFDIYGITREQYLSVIDRHKEALSARQGSIRFHGPVDHPTAIEKILHADFSIFFRDVNRATEAGFPTKFAESISCGTPVITTNTSDLADYLEEGVNGYFVDIQDHEKMMRKMHSILSTDKGRIRQMKKSSFESRIFDYRKYSENVRNFLHVVD